MWMYHKYIHHETASSVLGPDAGVAGGFLVHEGSVVTRGAKLILRTDVLYALPPPPQRG